MVREVLIVDVVFKDLYTAHNDGDYLATPMSGKAG